jgi:hypothetical protein
MSDINEKKISRCWEFFNCSEELKKKCRAYAENKKVCWLITTLDGGPRLTKKRSCFECKWYKLHSKNNDIKLLNQR